MKILNYVIALFLSILVIVLQLYFPDIFSNAPFLLATLPIIISTFVGGQGPGVISLVVTTFLVSYFYFSFNEGYLSITEVVQIVFHAIQGMLIIFLIEYLKEKRKQEFLQRRHFEVTLASIGDGVIAADKEGKILFMNDMAEALTGWKSKEARGKHLDEVLHLFDEKSKKKMEYPIQKVIKEGKNLNLGVETKILLQTKDGPDVPIDDSIAPIRNNKGEIHGVVIVFRDITERKVQEEQRELLLGVTSHELKNTLAGMKGYIQLLQKLLNNKSASNVKNYVDKVENKIQVLIRIVNNLMDMSKIKAGVLDIKKEEFDLNELVHEIISDQKQTVKRHTLQREGEIIKPVYADRDRIGQVLTNLILNAIKYSPEGDKVIIDLKENHQKVVVSVKDFGLGIPKDKKDQLFTPFYRAVDKQDRAKISGAGLGLYIANEIVKQNGGRLWLESKEGKGSTFYFTVPLASKYSALEEERGRKRTNIFEGLFKWLKKL